MRNIIRNALGLAAGAAFFATALAGSAAAVGLPLINGWTGAPFGTSKPYAFVADGVVRLKGAIATSGVNSQPFVLPVGFRPSALTYVPVGLCNAHKGRLVIQTDGTVSVQALDDFADAQCFTSLDGVRFAVADTGYKPLKLKHGWGEYGTRLAAAKNIDGIVHLEGAIDSSKNNANAFKLSSKFAPATTVYVPVDLCDANNGRLVIHSDGSVDVQAEASFSNAKCFTSLEGVYFAQNAALFDDLSLLNGWTNAPFSTSNAAVRLVGKTVFFKGAVASGTNTSIFVLPAPLRPKKPVYLNIDLCGSAKGRLFIGTDGTASVGGDFTSAQCFTSLDGASFSL